MAAKESGNWRRGLGCAAAALALAGIFSALEAKAAGDVTYLVHTPENAQPHPPLIVLLHGAGADERDMITMWHDLPGDFVAVSPRAPFPNGGGFRWYRNAGAAPQAGDFESSRAIVDRVIDNAVSRFDVDPQRIFIAGFSQGAVMVYEITAREPGRFRGAAVLSGSLFASTAALLSAGSSGAHTSFFVAHGTADQRVPVGAAKAGETALASHGFPVALHIYPGMGHETGAQELSDLDAWLIEHGANGAAAAK
jgi:phospholipase/carboxylesterase